MSGFPAAIILRTDYSRVFSLERFVDGFTAVPTSARLRAKLVASELFDNLLAHGRDIRPPIVVLSLSAGPPLALTFRFRSSNLSEFIAAAEAAKKGLGVEATKRYDSEAGLYRGFGLFMCGRLSSSIRARRGLLWHRVSVVF